METGKSEIGKRKQNAVRALVIIAQVLLGITFILSGVTKGIDPMGTAIKIREYGVAFGVPLGGSLASSIAVVLNLFEASLGFLLLAGVMPRVTRVLTLLLMVPMTLLTLYIAIFNPVSDCGCFGDAITLSNSATFFKNVVLLLLAIFVYLKVDLWWRLMPRRYDIFILLATIGIVLLFNLYSFRHLPVVDFRPYRVGSDIYELTIGSAEEGEYEYRFVYEREGVERSFGLDEIETELDDSWNYVRDETIELKAPVQAVGSDFILTREDGSSPMEDLMDKAGGYTLLYIAPDLTRVADEDLMLGCELQKRTGEPVWLVMGNSWSLLDEEKYSTLASGYSALFFLDRSTALTVIRSQPGIVVVKDGTIIRKTSIYDLREIMENGGEKVRDILLSPMDDEEISQRRYRAFGPFVLWGFAVPMLAWSWKREKNAQILNEGGAGNR